YWCWVFVILFFAIHVGRMRVYWTPIGLIDPLVAVAGDVGGALLLAFGVILPLRLAWRMLTRPPARDLWKRAEMAAVADGRLRGRLRRGWLLGRLRFSRCLVQMRHSPGAALRWGLQAGLTVTAVIVAISPIWGRNNYFFNTETWATGVWDRWA